MTYEAQLLVLVTKSTMPLTFLQAQYPIVFYLSVISLSILYLMVIGKLNFLLVSKPGEPLYIIILNLIVTYIISKIIINKNIYFLT